MSKSILGHTTSRVSAPFKLVAVLLALATTIGVPGSVRAELVEIQWNTKVSAIDGNWPATIGDDITISIYVDNGTAGLEEQTWDISDFSHYRASGDGWSFVSNDINGFSSGDFSTDSGGAVTGVGSWKGFGVDTTASFADAQLTEWVLNGSNPIVIFEDNDSNIYALDVADVGLSAIGSSWTATTVVAVPEPSTYAMMAIGLVGIAGLRRRQNKA